MHCILNYGRHSEEYKKAFRELELCLRTDLHLFPANVPANYTLASANMISNAKYDTEINSLKKYALLSPGHKHCAVHDFTSKTLLCSPNIAYFSMVRMLFQLF